MRNNNHGGSPGDPSFMDIPELDELAALSPYALGAEVTALALAAESTDRLLGNTDALLAHFEWIDRSGLDDDSGDFDDDDDGGGDLDWLEVPEFNSSEPDGFDSNASRLDALGDDGDRLGATSSEP